MTLEELKKLTRGDVVKLNSGSPDMTVSEIDASDVTCNFWHPEKNKFENMTLDYAELTLVKQGN